MWGAAAATPPREPEEDCEARTDLGPHHVAMFRACRLGTYEKTCPFVLRHASCNEDVRYNSDSKDPPASTWTCSGCTAPGNLLFTDLELKSMSMVRMQQILYVARRYTSKEEILKLDFNNERGHGHMYTRPMTAAERTDYHLRIIDESLKAFVRGSHQ